MDYEIVVPPTADGNLEVTVVRWLAEVGQAVQQGRDLVEATTKKIALYVSSPVDGTLMEIRIAEGGTAFVGDVLGIVRAA